MADGAPTSTIELDWDAPRASNADVSNAPVAHVSDVNIVDVVNRLLGYDALLAEGSRRFASEDEWLAEWDMGAQVDTLEPYDES